MKKHKIDLTESSGNIYQDLEFGNADQQLAKPRLAMRIEQIIQERKLKQTTAAKILGINQPKISALINGQLKGFSIERLIHFLKLLHQNVDIVISNQKIGSHEIGDLNVIYV